MTERKQLTVEDALESIGSFKLFHKILCIQILVYAIPDGFAFSHFSLSHYTPDHHCKLPNAMYNFSLKNVTTKTEAFQAGIPRRNDEDAFDHCHMYLVNYTELAANDQEVGVNFSYHAEVVECMFGVEFDTSPEVKTVPTEFSIVCDNDWKAPIAIFIFQGGVALGSLFGNTADRFGRKRVFLFSYGLQVASMVLVAISWNFYWYCVALLLCGFGSILAFIALIIICTEITVERWRNQMAIIAYYSVSTSLPVMGLTGYLFQNWRWFIGSLTVLTTILFLPSIWLLPESPRWLIERGQTDKAAAILRKMAKINKRENEFEDLTEKNGSELVSKSLKKYPSYMQSIRTLMKRGMRGRFLTCAFGWFTEVLVYFAITLFSTDFSSNRFLNIAYSGLAELPGLLVAQILLNYVGRPRTVFLLLVISAFSSLSLPFLRSENSSTITVVALIGKGCISGAFYCWYLIALEIFPTLQRSTGMSFCSMFARTGGFLAPFIMYLRKTNVNLPNLILGSVTAICAIVTIFNIPETQGVTIPDTLEDAINNKRFYRLKLWTSFSNIKVVQRGEMTSTDNVSTDLLNQDHRLPHKT